MNGNILVIFYLILLNGSLDRSVSTLRVLGIRLINFLPIYPNKITISKANSEDSGKMPLMWHLIWVYTVFQCPFMGLQP